MSMKIAFRDEMIVKEEVRSVGMLEIMKPTKR